jgi:hypothetical protein
LAVQPIAVAVAAAAAEAEPTPAFNYSFTLEGPLAPRNVNFTQQQGGKITLHMYSFSLSSSSSSSDQLQQQHCDDELWRLLNMAVGSAERCAAVPGVTASSSSSSSSSAAQNSSSSAAQNSSSSSLEFGALLWEPLPAGQQQQLTWPAWTHEQQQQPYMVSGVILSMHDTVNSSWLCCIVTSWK